MRREIVDAVEQPLPQMVRESLRAALINQSLKQYMLIALYHIWLAAATCLLCFSPQTELSKRLWNNCLANYLWLFCERLFVCAMLLGLQSSKADNVITESALEQHTQVASFVPPWLGQGNS